jgi:iron complex outermembrane recepter protein
MKKLLSYSLGLFLVLTTVSLAQTQQGQISGSVIEMITRKYLEGSEIFVQGTDLKVTTEHQGLFNIRNVPVGTQTLIVSYPGLLTKTLEVVVYEGKTSTVEVKLSESDVVTLSEFKVAGAKEGMAQAVALRKASINSKIVAASDQYGDVAEGNAAEYLKFLPGIGIDYNANDARAITLRGMNTQFTNVNMNGNPIASATSGNLNRRFEFEQAPINNVETIEVIKTLSPDIPATSTAGDINFISKSAFDHVGTLATYRIYFQGLNNDLTLNKTEGWGQEKTRKILPGVDLNYSTLINPELGFTVSYKNSQLFNDYPRAQYTWEYNPANGGTPTNPIISNFALQNEQKDTRRQSLSVQIDKKYGEDTKITFLSSWAFYDLLFTDRVVTVAPGTSAALSTTSPSTAAASFTGTKGKGSVALQTINRWKSGVTWDFPVMLSHNFANGSKLDTSVYWTQAYSKYRDTTGSWYSDMTMTRGGINPSTNTVTDPITVSFANIGSIAPSYVATDVNGTAIDLTDISKYNVTQIRSRPQTGVDSKDGYNLDYKFDLKTTIPISLKVGGRYDENTRNIVNPIYNRTGVTTATGFLNNAITGSTLSALADTGFSHHPIGYGLPAYNFINLYTAFKNLGGTSILPYTPASDIQARFEESTEAEYARFDITPYKNFIISGGVRYENRKTMSQNRLLTLTAPVTAYFSDSSYYPSLNFKYTPINKLVLRASYSKSIGLPDFSDLLPGPLTITDPTSSARGKVSVYNPNLKAYKVDNFDAGLEYYFGSSSYVSATVFRKKMSNYIITATQSLDDNYAKALGIPLTSFGAPTNQYDVTTKFNVADSGYYNGIELMYAQTFTSLPAPFNTLGLQINGTIISINPINSRAVFNSTDTNANAIVLDQIRNNLALSSAKQSLNVSVNYTYHKFGINLQSNYTGHVLKSVTQKTVKYSDLALNQYFNELLYQAPRETIDFRLDYKWSTRLTPYVQVRNIFGRSIVWSTPSLPFNHAEYGDPIYEVGIRGVW